MLTVEMLKLNTALTGLTDVQLSAIAEMSKNDENTVIGAKIGALHQQYDTDILTVTGIAKNQGEKSYDYTKRVLNDYKTKLAASNTLQTQLDAAKKEVEILKAKIASGSADEQLKQQLKDAKTLSAQLQQQLTQQVAEATKQKEQFEAQIKGIYVDNAFAEAISGLKFKSGITDSLKDVLIKAAKAEVLTKGKPDFIDNNGTKVLVFRDEAGNVINNPANNLNPFTAQELLLQTPIKDVIEQSKVQPGGGTKNPGGNPGGGQVTLLDLSAAKTQVEADKIIENHLLSNGLTRDSAEFAQQSMKLRTDNNVSGLPLR